MKPETYDLKMDVNRKELYVPQDLSCHACHHVNAPEQYSLFSEPSEVEDAAFTLKSGLAQMAKVRTSGSGALLGKMLLARIIEND